MQLPHQPSPLLLPLPYLNDSLSYFHTINASLPMAVILQSDHTASHTSTSKEQRGRFDIITAAPAFWLETINGHCRWQGESPPAWLPDQSHSFAALHHLVDDILRQQVDYTACKAEELPFCGGLIGYCSYDLSRELAKLPSLAEADILGLPDMQFGFFAWACIQDHRRRQSWLVIHPDCENRLAAQLPELLKSHPAYPSYIEHTDALTQPFSSNLSTASYSEKFLRIQEYIQAGDCYQVNFSQRFSRKTSRSALGIYTDLRKILPSPFCALFPILGSNGDAIISLSPERFLQLTPDGTAISQPIKGTVPRESDSTRDREVACQLQHDPKNRAENLMIVDLLRNDFGKICITGSVRTSRLFELQTFANVHHLVSTIHGQLTPDRNGADLMEACFPGGSITGAPKLRAMQIIDELEPHRRSIYCGSIALFSAHGSMDSNILIRTLLLKDQTLHCWGGGGIVADSDCDSEYQESIAKVRNILDAIDNFSSQESPA